MLLDLQAATQESLIGNIQSQVLCEFNARSQVSGTNSSSKAFGD